MRLVHGQVILTSGGQLVGNHPVTVRAQVNSFLFWVHWRWLAALATLRWSCACARESVPLVVKNQVQSWPWSFHIGGSGGSRPELGFL